MAERTIFLKKRPIRKEGIAGAAIVPGMLVKLQADGKYDPHNVAGGKGSSFAFEYELTGKDIDQAYALDDNLLFGVCSAGAEVYALLAANASAVVKGAYLESAGDGTLRVVTPGDDDPAVIFPGNAIAMALEDVDNSAGASRARIIVEIL